MIKKETLQICCISRAGRIWVCLWGGSGVSVHSTETPDGGTHQMSAMIQFHLFVGEILTPDMTQEEISKVLSAPPVSTGKTILYS